MATGFAAPAMAQLNALGSVQFVYQLGELHEDPRDFHPYAPLSYILHPDSRPWGKGAVQLGGDVTAIATSGDTIFGLPASQWVGTLHSGRTFAASASAPWDPGSPARGGYAEIDVGQTYIKESDNATLRFTYNFANIQLMNYGGSKLQPLGGRVEMIIEVHKPDGMGFPVWADYQAAWFTLDYRNPADPQDDIWSLETTRPIISTAEYPKWEWLCSCTRGAYGNGEANLKTGSYTQFVDLSDIGEKEEFFVSFTAFAAAWDYVQGETAASARLQDPIGTGGFGLEIEGLTPTNRAALYMLAVPEPSAWALHFAGLTALATMAAVRRGRAARS